MQFIQLTFEKTALELPLITEYLNKNNLLQDYYQFAPNSNEIPAAIENRKQYTVDRELLANVIVDQYAHIKSINTAVKSNIEKLRQENTFTITTGHQANIFSGPLYYWYKIADTINYANHLSKIYPEYNFIPLYWLASEDHDFEEINHIHLFGKTYTWQNNGGGATGRLDPKGIQTILDEIKPKLDQNENGKEIFKLFEKAYTSHDNLADATRFWINELMGYTGLLILNPDHAQLKSKIKNIIIQDVVGQEFEPMVNSSKDELEKNFPKLPVNPRKINFFYLDSGLRERIVNEGDQFKVLNTEFSFSLKQMQELIEEKPEKFSPNVIMRPVYQEAILPNLAYFGGTTEIAYWLELKSVFQKAGIFFPQLLVRNSVFWIGGTLSNKIQKLGLKSEDFLTTKEFAYDQLIKKLNVENDAETLISKLIEHYEELKNGGIPQSIRGEIGKKAALHQKELKNIRKTIKAALKQENSKQIEQFEKIYNSLFINGIPQERYENFISYYLLYGKDFIKILLENLPIAGGKVNIIET